MQYNVTKVIKQVPTNLDKRFNHALHLDGLNGAEWGTLPDDCILIHSLVFTLIKYL